MIGPLIDDLDDFANLGTFIYRDSSKLYVKSFSKNPNEKPLTFW